MSLVSEIRLLYAGVTCRLARGGRDDPQFGNRFPFPPIVPARIVGDGEQVQLGGVSLTAHITAGHTPGCTTWTMTLLDGSRNEQVVFLCSPSVPQDYKLSGNPRYPEAIGEAIEARVTQERK